MKISVNGQPRDVAVQNLASMLDELGFGGTTVATAVNGEFVPVASRTSCDLAEDDQLEILAPMQGG